MRFEVLGPTRVVAVVRAEAVEVGDAPAALGGPKQRLVLALLLAEPNRPVSVDRLIEGLWGDEPPDSARHTIQSYVSELRKLVGSVIERTGAGYRIQVDPRTLDTIDFEDRLSEARRTAATDPAQAADDLEDALALWRGVPFGDLGRQSTLEAESVRLEELRVVAVEIMMEARIGSGRHAEVVAELDRLTRTHPYREELRALHMLALYRSGRQAEALRAYRTTRDVLGEDLGIVPSPRLRRLEEQILLQDPELDEPHNPSPATEDRHLANPYLGLRAFREADHGRYFGQEHLVGRLITRVEGDAGLTAVVGPSGCGKSSAVQAGLIPSIRRDHPEFVIALMQPGARPLDALGTALAEIDGAADGSLRSALDQPDGLVVCARRVLHNERRRVVLVIDQFEELFTMADDAEARRFLDLLAQGVRDEPDALHVVATLRADFYDRPLAEPRFGRLFADNVVTVVVLGPDELTSAATIPARQLDIEIEPRLVGRLVADVAGQPNALPLFQYALTELFDARTGSVLDLATYERIGGVRKAVARRADSLYGQLDAVEQEAARQLFLRIATVSGDVVGRRRVPASELVSLDLDVVALRNVIDVFACHRLLVIDRDPASGSPTVEVAHEALLIEWHELRDWIDRHRDDLTKQASFLAAVEEWETSGRDPGYLLTGTRLEAYREWASDTQLRLTSIEQDFLDAAVVTHDAEAADAVERDRHQLQLQRRVRRQLAALFAAAALLGGVIAYPIVTGSGDPERLVAVLASERDKSVFDDLIAGGVEAAAAEFGFEAAVMEPPYADPLSEVRSVADGAGLVFASSILSEGLLLLAAEMPNTVFALLDSTEAPAPNSVAISFRAEEGSFLVGAAAALESETRKVGFIGGNGSPVIEGFRVGFEQGVAAVADDVEVVSATVVAGIPESMAFGFQNPALARELAAEMYDAGVDVIYVAAGSSGLGVLEAAVEQSSDAGELWVIGADSDWSLDVTVEEREHVLVSMFKRFDVAVSAVVEAYESAELRESDSFSFGVVDDAVGYTDTVGNLDPATVQRLEALRAALADGSIVVDDVLEYSG